jgi:hypothetical protein
MIMFKAAELRLRNESQLRHFANVIGPSDVLQLERRFPAPSIKTIQPNLAKRGEKKWQKK